MRIDAPDAIARRLAAIVESSDDAIISKDLNGIVQSWNEAAERIFGFTAAEMIGQSIRRIIPDDRQREEDRVLASIRAGRRVDHFETVRQTRDGHFIPVSLTVSPILDAHGAVIGASKIARDISDRKSVEEHVARAARRDAFIADVTLVLTRSLDYEQALKAVSGFIVPYIADYCAIDVLNDEGALSRLALTHVLPEKARRAEDIRARYEDPTSSSSPQHVMATRSAFFAPEVRDEMLVAAANGDEQGLAAIRALGLVSYMCVPMVAHDHALGSLTLATAESGRRFTTDDLRLAQDVALRAALAVDNAQSYQQLQTANRLKDEFLATLSHELRTPLNAVLGYARMLQSGAVPQDKVAQALDVIDRNAGALAQIVEDVLDVSRIILGKARLRMEPVDVTAVVEDAIATVLPAIEAKGLRLERAIQDDIGRVSGDPNRLQQVVWNLLSNAVKFTPRGGCIEVRLGAHEGEAEVVVADTGVGFPPSFKPHIFERFRQAESGTTRLHGGLGLGLSIASHIVEMHGGTIDASSEGEGKGARFTVRLPLIDVGEAVRR